MAIKLKIELLKNTEEVERVIDFELEPYVHFNYSINPFGMVFKLSNKDVDHINNSQIDSINKSIQAHTTKDTFALRAIILAGSNIVLTTTVLNTMAYDITNDSNEIVESLRFVEIKS